MNYEMIGKVILKEDTVDISASFRKREFVIEVENERNPEWNDFIKFQATQDRCDMLNNYEVGDAVRVHFNIRGRKWEKDGKINYFSNLEAWRLEKVEEVGVVPPVSAPPFSETDVPTSDSSDDLPF